MDNQTVTEGAKLCSLINSEEDIRQWDSYVLEHPHGSIFHLSSWQRLVESSFNHKPFHIIARGKKGSISGVLPLFFVHSRIFGRMLISTFQAAYGGILADTDSDTQMLLAKASEIAIKKSAKFLELRNFNNVLEHPDLLKKDLYVTFRQELYEDPEKNLLAIPRKTRAECRKGISNGLEFKVNEIGVEGFYRIYSRSVRDLGTPVFTKKLFTNGLREFGDNCKIFSVHWKGKPVAAVWTLFFKDEVAPYYGGSLREYNHLAVNNYMYWMLIKFGIENGFKVFDFGRSKIGTGSFHFKKRWGMTMIDLPYQYLMIRTKSLPDTSPLNPKFSLGIRLWQKLPISIANTFGPFISKHLV